MAQQSIKQKYTDQTTTWVIRRVSWSEKLLLTLGIQKWVGSSEERKTMRWDEWWNRSRCNENFGCGNMDGLVCKCTEPRDFLVWCGESDAPLPSQSYFISHQEFKKTLTPLTTYKFEFLFCGNQLLVAWRNNFGWVVKVCQNWWVFWVTPWRMEIPDMPLAAAEDRLQHRK